MDGSGEGVLPERRESGDAFALLRRYIIDGVAAIPTLEAADPIPTEAAVAVEEEDGAVQHAGAIVSRQAPGIARTTASESVARTSRRARIEPRVRGA